jgi:hypothetical protein
MGQVEKIRLYDDLDSKGSRQRNRHDGGCGSMVAYRSLDWAAGKRREDQGLYWETDFLVFKSAAVRHCQTLMIVFLSFFRGFQ